jgi:hypothetical protein
MKKPNVNEYWEHVLTWYPAAIFDFWFDLGTTGELHFYPSKSFKDAHAGDPYSCVKIDGKFTVLTEF